MPLDARDMKEQNHHMACPKGSIPWSRLGLGTGTLASMGRKAMLGEVEALLGAMAEIGANVIDTADTYGSGDCERLLGRAMRSAGSDFQVITKAGYRFADLPAPLRPFNQLAKKALQITGRHQCFAPGYLRGCAEGSLRRLGIESLGAFLLHSPPLAVVTDSGLHAMCLEIMSAGLAERVGISSEDPQVLSAAIHSGIFSVIETPANLRAAATLGAIWQQCTDAGIHLVGNHVLNPGCLAATGLGHEALMRHSAALFPETGTLLSGTRNPAHLRSNWQGVRTPGERSEALDLASLCEG